MSKIVCCIQWLVFCSMLLVLSGCRTDQSEVPHPAPSVYYWRSELRLSEGETAFLRQHEVRKVYLHLFDVVRRQGQLQPSTTLTVTDTFPEGIEVIPVVFLAPDVMRDTTGLAALPEILTRRVNEMMRQNDLGAPAELQIDFDWTRSNQQRYFALLRSLREVWRNGGEGSRMLSTTIRLHQLQMEAPPVDYGALMVYNVGRLQDPDEANSILTPELIRPYIKHLPHYPLPLCAALPVYSWDLLFHDRQFQCIVRGIDLADTTRFESIDPTHYRALSYQAIPPGGVTMRGEGRIFPGDVIRHEQVSAECLQQVMDEIQRLRPQICRQTILYHLDQNQLNQYTDDQLQTLYSRP